MDLKIRGFDFSQITVDNEGYIYALNVFYAGICSNNWTEGLWPHSSRLLERYELCPRKFAYDYQITNMGNELTLATFCHENGHMICSFPDLYDYGAESNGAGYFCLMSGGNVDQKNPTQLSAYLKYKSGWGKRVTPIVRVMRATIEAGENDFYIYAKNQAEYFIIENRNNTGRDRALPSSGLAIWHVDELTAR